MTANWNCIFQSVRTPNTPATWTGVSLSANAAMDTKIARMEQMNKDVLLRVSGKEKFLKTSTTPTEA